MAATEEESQPVCVCDAGPILHLYECGCLDLLLDFDSILLPEEVAEEVAKHRPTALLETSLPFRRVARKTALSESLSSLAREFSLHRGETEALWASLENSRCLLLTDDTAARLAARELEIPARGTIGVIVRAIRKERRSKEEVISILTNLPTCSTLHLRRAFLGEVIQRVKDSA